jgi:hypothetical protein
MEGRHTVGSIVDGHDNDILGYGKRTTVKILITSRAKLHITL